MAARKKARKQQTVTVRRPSTEEIRKATEDAGDTIDALGAHKMEFDRNGYAIRLSRRIGCRVTYDPGTGEIVLVLPDGSQCGVGEGHEREMGMRMHVAAIENAMEGLECAGAKLGRAGEGLARSWSARLCMDGGPARENAWLSKTVWDLQNQI